MSENFLSDLADQLRNQQSSEPTPVEPTPAEPIVVEPTPTEPAPVEPTIVEPTNTAVNDQITDSVTQQNKEWWEDAEPSPVNPTQTNPTPTEPKDVAIDLDDDLKLIAEYKKSGKTLADFVKEYQVQDVKTMTDEQIVKEGLKEFMGLSEEEYEQAASEYESASFFQKKQWADSFREKFEAKNSEKLKQLMSSNAKAGEYQEAVRAKYEAELTTFSEQIVNKEIYGLKVTDEMSKDLRNFVDKEFTLTREDGTFDIEKMYSIGLWLKYGKDLVKANVTKAKNEGREQVIKEVTNPSKNMTAGGRSVGSGLEAAQEAFNNLFPG
jgi:hypothetical protein